MKKKLIVLLLVVALVSLLAVSVVGCKEKDEFKIGLICLHDENSTYDKNFIDALKATQAAYGLSDEQVLIVTGVPEGDACYQEAAKLADAGCDIVFADSFGHEEYMIKAAKEYPDVQFCHATGTRAHTEELPNYANAFADIYEGRFLAGVAAGMKLNEMIAAEEFTADQAKMGYIGAYTYAEVISGYTSFYLGAKSVCSTVTMDVTFTGSWYDETAENNSAVSLIERGCKLISQHADSWGAPNACEEAGVPNVSYNGSTESACPNTFIVSSRIDWSPYYNYVIEQVQAGEAVAYDWVGTLANGGVKLTNLGAIATAEGTATELDTKKAELIAGTLNVYDTSTFAVSLEQNPYKGDYITIVDGVVTSYLADVDDYGDLVGETEVIADGVFQESVYRSAPYFDLTIGGITLLDTNFG